jgi:hypothetical protein
MSQNIDEMWIAIQEEWEKIDLGFVNNLIQSMPRCAMAVQEARGGHTKY